MTDSPTNRQGPKPSEEQDMNSNKIETEITTSFSNIDLNVVIGDTAPKDPNNMEEEKEEVKYHFEKDAEDYSFKRPDEIEIKTQNEQAEAHIYTHDALLSLLATLQEQLEQPQSEYRSVAVARLQSLIQSNFESALHNIDDAITKTGPVSFADYKKENADVLSDIQNRWSFLSKTERRLNDYINEKGLSNLKAYKMSNDGDAEEEEKVPEGRNNRKPQKYYEQMENTLANNQVYNQIEAFVKSGKEDDEFASRFWPAEDKQWIVEKNKTVIRHDEKLPEMRPKLINSILGRLKYAFDDKNLSPKVRKNLKSCRSDVINFLTEHFENTDALLYMFNISRGLADREESMNNFISELSRIKILPTVDMKPKDVSTELNDLQAIAFYFYKLILETPLVYNAIRRLFTEEVNRDNGYDYNFNADNSNHLDKVLRHYRAIKVVITGKTVLFDGMVGKDNEVYINIDELANGKDKKRTITQKVANVMQVMFHEATHSAIRQESPQGYAGYTHSPKRPRRSDSVFNNTPGKENETIQDEEMEHLEAGYRFENYVFGAHDRNFTEQQLFAKRMLLRKNYMKAGSKARLFTSDEAQKLSKNNLNYEFSGIKCGLPDLGRSGHR